MSQSQISRTLRDEAAVTRIASILSQERFDSRSALGRRICKEFSFADARGRPQLAGCMKALGALAERVPDIVLPPPKASVVERRTPAQHRGPRARRSSSASHADPGPRDRCGRGRGAPGPVEHADRTRAPARDDDVCGLPGALAHGWLGAAGFAAAALRAAARDRWIGWDDAGRRGHLQRVVCLSRFLIRPSVRCPHLASHVLGRILRRLPGDFEERYGFRPYLVETSPTRDITGRACARPTSCASARPPGAVARTGRNAGRGP